jgi:hypothetical protein
VGRTTKITKYHWKHGKQPKWVLMYSDKGFLFKKPSYFRSTYGVLQHPTTIPFNQRTFETAKLDP